MCFLDGLILYQALDTVLREPQWHIVHIEVLPVDIHRIWVILLVLGQRLKTMEVDEERTFDKYTPK